MMKQNGLRTLLLATGALVVLIAAAPAAAQVSLYHMDFKPADATIAITDGPNNFAMTDFGWDNTHGQAGAPGVYFPNVGGLNPEDPTNRAFVYLFGSGGQNSSTFTSSNTTSGGTANSSFPAGGINPSAPANAGLGFSWSQHLENGANVLPIGVRIAVQTAAGNWYASNSVFNTGTTGAGSQGNFDPQSLIYNPVKTNWLNLTIGAAPADGVTIGSTPSVDLSGNITGVGFVASFNQPASTTVHIDFIDVGIPPVPGDVTGNRIVDINDYNIIKANFGTNVASRSLGDVTGDGVVNLLDFAQWKNNFPFPGGGSGSLGNGTVPEPASAILLVISLPLGWSIVRSRKKSDLRSRT
jgi:hypothetical protein